MRRLHLILTLFLTWIQSFLFAQNPYMHQYTTSDGLPSNAVYYVFQDSRKFIWFATEAGVSRYDGSTFTNYTRKSGLSSREVIFIKEDSFGRVWFLHLNGSLSYIQHNKIFNESNTGFIKQLEGKDFYFDFFQDKDSTIYFYNKGCEITALDKSNRVTRYNLIEKLLLVLPTHLSRTYGIYMRYLTKSEAGDFLIWTGQGMFKIRNFQDTPVFLTHSSWGLKVYPLADSTFIVDSYNDKLYQFKDSGLVDSIILPFYKGLHLTSVIGGPGEQFWVAGFLKGVYFITGNKVTDHFNIHRPESLLRDHEGNIWVGTLNDGVVKISPYYFAHRHYPDSLFEQKGITGMCADGSGGVWLTNGTKICLLKKNLLYELFPGDGKSYINFITQVTKGTLIFGERGIRMSSLRGVGFENNKRIMFAELKRIELPFKDIAFSRKSEEIIAFGGADLFLSDRAKLFDGTQPVNSGQRIYSFFYNPENNLIMNGRKMLVRRKNGFFPYPELSRFDNKIITSHLIIDENTELFNVEGDSIYLFKSHEFFNLTNAFDFPIDNQVIKIVYHQPTLYLCSSTNVYSCDNLREVLTGRKAKLRLLDIDFNNIHELIVNNDSLYIASDDGLTVIPEALKGEINTRIPIPYLRSVFVNDQEMEPYCREVRVRGATKIAFSFGCINYSAAPVIYAYKLKGIDADWTTGISKNVVYQNLNSGEYIFELKVRKPTAAWSQPIEFPIVIKASLWRHPLLITSLAILLLAGLIYAIIRRKNLQIRKWEIDNQLILLEQKSLQSMMNPHFIFNSLGSIQNYLLQKKSGEAGLYLSQFARLIRQNMNAINTAMINLEEEVDRLKNYLDLEKLRMEDKFEYHIEVDENLEEDDILIPSMIIQPFVENSIWHGISPMEEHGFIGIYFIVQDEHSMKVIIEDNGIGIRQAGAFKRNGEKHLHLGMEMTRKRLDLLGRKYAVKTQVEFSELKPGNVHPGTRVTLVMPTTYPGTPE